MISSDIRGDGEQLEALCDAIAALGDPAIRRAIGRLSRSLRGRQAPDAVAIADRVRDEIRRAGKPVGRRELLRRLRVPAASLDDALRLWVHSGWIRASTDNSTGGRPQIVFELDDPTEG